MVGPAQQSHSLTCALQTGHRQQYARQMEARQIGEARGASSERERGSYTERLTFSVNPNLTEA